MFQKTLKKPIYMKGIALHSGKKVSLKIMQASENAGITFIRTDIKGQPRVKASVKNVKETKRGTNLVKGKAKILTVEHLLSALSGTGITNAVIEIDGPEPPILDGSAKEYVKAIKKAGIKKQNRKIPSITINKPILIHTDKAQIMAIPSDRFVVSFMINYPSIFVGTQVFGYDSSSDNYEKQVAPARTYGFMDEVKGLRKAGLIKGATKKNVIAISHKGYLTKLRFSNELVRHKTLDLIGDLALTGCYIRAQIVGIRSGHNLNVQLAKKILLGGKRK